MEKNTNNYVIKEIFYSNGVTFRKERFNKETGEEITQYFSKNGEFIVEIKNSTLNNNEIIYDIYSQKFLVKKNGKFYDKEVIYTKKIKYYYDAGSIEEEFDDCGRIHGSRKVYDTDGDLYEDSFWQYGKPSNMENQLVLAKHIIKMENCEAKDIKNIIIMREYSSGIMKVGNYI